MNSCNNATSQAQAQSTKSRLAPKKGTLFSQPTTATSSQIVILENREIAPPTHTMSQSNPLSPQENATFFNDVNDVIIASKGFTL